MYLLEAFIDNTFTPAMVKYCKYPNRKEGMKIIGAVHAALMGETFVSSYRERLPADERSNNTPPGKEGENKEGNMIPRPICLCHHPSPQIFFSSSFPALSPCQWCLGLTLSPLLSSINLIMLHWGDACWQTQSDADEMKLLWFWCVTKGIVWCPQWETGVEMCLCLMELC